MEIERGVIARELATVAIPKGFQDSLYEVFLKIQGIATPVCALVRNDTIIYTRALPGDRRPNIYLLLGGNEKWVMTI